MNGYEELLYDLLHKPNTIENGLVTDSNSKQEVAIDNSDNLYYNKAQEER